MARFSGGLIQTAHDVAARLETSVVGGLAAICMALLASTLQDALEHELTTADCPDARSVLEGAIQRCRKAASIDPERGRDELALVTAYLIGPEPARATPPRPRLRVITGGLAGSRA
jgi:hypothetical protein